MIWTGAEQILRCLFVLRHVMKELTGHDLPVRNRVAMSLSCSLVPLAQLRAQDLSKVPALLALLARYKVAICKHF